MLTLLKPYGTLEPEREQVDGLVELLGLGSARADVRDPAFCRLLDSADLLMGDVDVRITDELLGCAPHLRAVLCRSIGVDFVDLDAATRRGVLVVNSPSFCAVAVAEYALALMLCAAHQIVPAYRAVRDGRWGEREGLRGIELTGKTLGLCGFGQIGREVARRARGLGMQTVAYDPFLGVNTLASDQTTRLLSLEDMLAAADVVSVHVPLTDGTRGLLGRRELARMRDGAILINVSRGGVVEESALLDELLAGRLTAALDVLSQEPPAQEHPLNRALPNLILTPHAAWNTREASEKNRATFLNQLESFARGETPIGVVNRQVLPEWTRKWGGATAREEE